MSLLVAESQSSAWRDHTASPLRPLLGRHAVGCSHVSSLCHLGRLRPSHRVTDSMAKGQSPERHHCSTGTGHRGRAWPSLPVAAPCSRLAAASALAQEAVLRPAQGTRVELILIMGQRPEAPLAPGSPYPQRWP